MGSCLSIHPRNQNSSQDKGPLPVLLPDDVADVRKKLANVKERIETEKLVYGIRTWKYSVLSNIRGLYEKMLLVGELPFTQQRNMEKDNLGAKIAMLEDLLRSNL